MSTRIECQPSCAYLSWLRWVGRGLVVWLVCVVVLLASGSAQASMAGGPSAEPGTIAAEPAAVDVALEAGDLTTAREQAVELRKADPSPANWHTEGEVLERTGDYAGAAAAYQAELKALPAEATEARALAKEALVRVKAQARGTVEDEPASQHREQLDEHWFPKQTKPAPKPTPKPAPQPVAADRIIKKWYFWVTIGAIVASAAAVTGIAIRAARDEQPDALGLQRAVGPMGPAVLRF